MPVTDGLVILTVFVLGHMATANASIEGRSTDEDRCHHVVVPFACR